MLKEQEGPPEKPKLITEEKQSARRGDAMSFIRLDDTTGRTNTLFSQAKRKGLSQKVYLLLPEVSLIYQHDFVSSDPSS